MADLPWVNIAVPADRDMLSMRRIDEHIRWNFYWARNWNGDFLLVLRCPADGIDDRLPRLKSVDILLQRIQGDEHKSLILRLADMSLAEIFHRLCLDILASASGAESSTEAVRRAIGRTWRWHHLLRGGGGVLSADEQRGLLGELLVLERYILPPLGSAAAIESWHGPLGSAQDFIHGDVRVESKACGPSTSAVARISSEQQLDTSGGIALFLAISVFQQVDQPEQGSFSLTDVAERLRMRIADGGAVTTGRFESLLAAAGFDASEAYGDWMWRGSTRAMYRVSTGFPCITPGSLPSGVHRVSYDLSLAECGEWAVAAEELNGALGTLSDG